MKHCIDPTLLHLLRRGIEAGIWTMEDLDQPSAGFAANTGPDREFFKAGYEGVQFRNLLRETTAAPEAVQVTSERDLPPLPHGVTPAQPDGPLTLEQEPETPFVPF